NAVFNGGVANRTCSSATRLLNNLMSSHCKPAARNASASSSAAQSDLYGDPTTSLRYVSGQLYEAAEHLPAPRSVALALLSKLALGCCLPVAPRWWIAR